ncbi:unnamed protein product [Symbiodinium necroappetens]|uniref:Cyclic nucleotide-binding domain-containing protein n=1 Tax=Symbiodinium necroappetens TaxID=1628268 RepID=A0A812NTK3_9DINO|nr:unnamed protein product [Symbiodinium necroappetens]
MDRQETTGERYRKRQQQRSIMAVMDPYNPPASKKRADGGRLSLRDWKSWLSAFSAAVPLFLLSYSSCVSYAHLIVSGAYGYPIRAVVITSMHLFSSGLTGLILPMRSKCPLIIPSADISVTMFYQMIVMDIVKAAADDGTLSPEAVAATAMLALPVNTILMSLVFFLVGEQKATVVVSYLPYPVVAGFLGSIGLAIFVGAFAVLEDGLSGFSGIAQAAHDKPWPLFCAVGMALSSILLKYAGLPARVLAVAPTLTTMVVFWLCVAFSGLSLEEIRQDGWLFPAASFEPFWSIWTEQHPSQVVLHLLPPKLATFLGLGFVLILSLTLRIAGIEGSTGYMIGVDEEVKWTGIASGIAGCCGTVIGSHSPGLTTFNAEAGSTTLQAAVLTAVLQLALWLSGFPVMNLFPRFLLSGILMNLGLVMLQEWMWTARHKVGVLGLLVIYAQVASSAMYGLLPSVLVGVAVALVTAQVQLMKLHVLKYHVSRVSVKTNLHRSDRERRILKEYGELIECLGLEGFLAEGPMIKLSNYVRQYVECNKVLRFIVFDLQACQGCNVSAYALLAKLDKVLQNEGICAYYSSLEADMSCGLKSFGVPADRIFDSENGSHSSFMKALQCCEDLVLESVLQVEWQRQISNPIDITDSDDNLQEKIRHFLGLTPDQVRQLCQAGAWQQKNTGCRLSSQGVCEATVNIAVPGSSKVVETVDVGSNWGAAQEVSSSKAGFICGLESVLYDEPSRSTCRVQEPSKVLCIKRAEMQQLVASEPSIANCLGRITTRQFLRHSDVLLQALQLYEGGGWRGGHFDKHTAQVCLNMLGQDSKEDASPSRRIQNALPEKLGNLSSPTVPRKPRMTRIQRQGTIDAWALKWWEERNSSTVTLS